MPCVFYYEVHFLDSTLTVIKWSFTSAHYKAHECCTAKISRVLLLSLERSINWKGHTVAYMVCPGHLRFLLCLTSFATVQSGICVPSLRTNTLRPSLKSFYPDSCYSKSRHVILHPSSLLHGGTVWESFTRLHDVRTQIDRPMFHLTKKPSLTSNKLRIIGKNG